MFSRIDQFDRREEAKTFTKMFDGLYTKGSRDVRFASAGATIHDHILSSVHKLAAMQPTNQGLVDLAGGKGEGRDILVSRKAHRLHMVGDSAHFTFDHLCFEQLRESGWLHQMQVAPAKADPLQLGQFLASSGCAT
jgi:hypothetical protein